MSQDWPRPSKTVSAWAVSSGSGEGLTELSTLNPSSSSALEALEGERTSILGAPKGVGGASTAAASPTSSDGTLKDIALTFGLGTAAVGDLVDAPYFTPSERAAFREYDCLALPIFGDLVFDRSRSRLLTVLLFTLAGLGTFLQLFLPQLSFGPLQLQAISTCWQAAKTLSAFPGSAFSRQDIQVSGELSASLNGLYICFLLCSLLAVTPWNPPIFLLLGTTLSIAYFSLYSYVDTRFCVQLAAPGPLLISSLDARGAWINQVSTTVVFFNFAIWLAVLACMLELCRLTWLMLRSYASNGTPLAHFFALAHWPAPPPQQPQHTPLPPHSPAPTPTAGSAAAAAAAPPPPSCLATLRASAHAWLTDTYLNVLCVAPLRHCIACALSTLGLAVLASTISGWSLLALAQLRAFKSVVLDPSQALAPDTPPFLRQLLEAVNQYIPAIWRAAVVGALDSALVWSSIGAWLVAALFCATCAASMAVVARHRRELLLRNEVALEGAGVGVGPSSPRPPTAPSSSSSSSSSSLQWQWEAKRSTLTPPPHSLQGFVIFDATQYVVAHLVCHLFVYLVFFLIITVLVIG